MMKLGGRRVRQYKKSGVVKSTLALTALMLLFRVLNSTGALSAVDSALSALANNEQFVRGALSFELNLTSGEEGSPDSGTGSDSSTLFLHNPALSDVDADTEDNGGPDAQAAQIPATESAIYNGSSDPAPARSEVTLSSGNVYLADGTVVNNQTSKDIDIASLLTGEFNVDLSGDGPKVLIYHTHGSEAFTPDGDDMYIPTDTGRTEDSNYNILRVGREAARVFESYGIETIQATDLHDYPSYNGSYIRSLVTVEDYLREYPSIQIILDLHRDALEQEDGTVLKTVANLEGKSQTAQMLIIVGTDDDGLEHPNWQDNLRFGLALQEDLDEKYPTLARPLAIRSSRFNQHLSSNGLLIEIGCSGNTLQEALSCARLFAEVTAEFLLEHST